MSTKLFAAPNARVACPFVPPVSLPITPRSMTATYCEPSARVFRTCPLFCTPVSGFRNRVILWFLSALHCVPTHTLSLSRRRPRPTVPFLCMAIGPRSAMVDQCPNAPVSSAIDHSLSLLSSLDPKSSSTKKLLHSERAAMTSCRLHITAATQDSLMPGNCHNEYKRIPARESCQCAAAFRPLMPLMSKFMSSFLLPRRFRVQTEPGLLSRLQRHRAPTQHKGTPPRYIVYVRPAPVMRKLQKKRYAVHLPILPPLRMPQPHSSRQLHQQQQPQTSANSAASRTIIRASEMAAVEIASPSTPPMRI
jgi:hypothetical protein